MQEPIAGFDLVLMIVIFAFIAWELFGFFTTRGKIQMKAQVYGRFISLAIVVVLMIFAIIRRRADMDVATMALLLGGIFLGSLLNIFLPVGFGEKGLYYNGRLIAFGDVQYFNVERETTSSFTLRLRTKKREVALDFKQDQKPLAMAWMDKGGIPTMEAYLKENG